MCIIITPSVLLFFCWRQNKKANRKQHEARLHEIAVIAGRESGRRLHGHHSTPIRDNIPPYPPSIVQPNFTPFQGAPSYGCSPLNSFPGLQTPTAGTIPHLQHLQQLQQLQQLGALGLNGMAPPCLFPGGLVSDPRTWVFRQPPECFIWYILQAKRLCPSPDIPWLRLSAQRLPCIWYQAQASRLSTHGASEWQPL